MSHNRMVLSELPDTTNLSWYWRQAMPLLWPFKVRTNSHELVDQTLMVLSPLAETIYLSSKSTTFTAALCPTRTLLRLISVGLTMSHTAILLSLLQVTIIPSLLSAQNLKLKLRCSTASQWWMRVFTISPDSTSHTLTVLSLEPEMMTFSSYWRQSTEPVCPVSTLWCCCSVCLSHIFIVLSLSPLTIL